MFYASDSGEKVRNFSFCSLNEKATADDFTECAFPIMLEEFKPHSKLIYDCCDRSA